MDMGERSGKGGRGGARGRSLGGLIRGRAMVTT